LLAAPAPLRLGRRALDGISGVEILGPLEFEPTERWWYFPVRLTVEAESEHVPRVTNWYVLSSEDYPIGRVSMRPAQAGGIHESFRHMERNEPTAQPWRSGAPCLDRPGRWLGSPDLVNQPTSAAELMRWHVERALEWLEAAATNRLTGEREPFELPKFPGKGPTIGFDEDPQRFAVWRTTLGRAGDAYIKRLNDSLLVAYAFNVRAQHVVPVRWGQRLLNIEKTERAFWMTLRDLPVSAPWNAPSTWGELRSIARLQRVDLDGLLQWIYHHMHERNVTSEAYLLLGFPIPEIYDGLPVRMHWQPLSLPAPIDTSTSKIHVRKGAKTSAGAWSLERAQLLADDKPISWLQSEPWAEDRLAVRGSLSQALRDSRVVMLGGGALGAALAELLVRAGVNNIIICDWETFSVENLRRHTLTIEDAEYSKSLSLAMHLNACSPFADVGWASGFPNSLGVDRDRVRNAEVVIDCTASDKVAARLATFDWLDAPRWFFSGSLGVDARRLFCFRHHGTNFPSEIFFDAVRPYVDEERALLEQRDPLTMFRAGCWNPIFPARWDDIVALAARMLRIMESDLASGTVRTTLQVVDRAA